MRYVARAAADALAPLASRAADATGNTYKEMLEHGMSSGLYYVVLINILTAGVGLLVYHYIIQRQAGLLSPDERALLRKYPPLRASQMYTPEETFVRGAPPMRWVGWQDFFTASDHLLSRDAQVYLLFQRVCIATTALCAVVSSVVLLPAYWSGGALVGPGEKPISLVNLLRSDRGVFERFTSHNLPADSPLVLLQIPVVAVAAACVVVLHTLVHAAARDRHLTVEDWLRAPPSPVARASASIFGPSDAHRHHRPSSSVGTPSPSASCRTPPPFPSPLPADVGLAHASPFAATSMSTGAFGAAPSASAADSDATTDVISGRDAEARQPARSVGSVRAAPKIRSIFSNPLSPPPRRCDSRLAQATETPLGVTSVRFPVPVIASPMCASPPPSLSSPAWESPSLQLLMQSPGRLAPRCHPRPSSAAAAVTARHFPDTFPVSALDVSKASVYVSENNRSAENAIYVDTALSPRVQPLYHAPPDASQFAPHAETPPGAGRNLETCLDRSTASPLANVRTARNNTWPTPGWTLFARGLPMDIRSRAELESLLDVIYPGQIRSVELVCKRRMSEAKLLRALSVAQNRLEYLLDSPHLDYELQGAGVGDPSTLSPAMHSVSQNPWDRLLRRLFRKRRTRQGLIFDLRAKIETLERDLSSRTAEPVRQFLGCAFITVGSPEVAASLMRDFPVRFRIADGTSGVRVWSINGTVIPETQPRPSTDEADDLSCEPGSLAAPRFYQYSFHEIPYYHPRHRGFLHDEDDSGGWFGVFRLYNLYHALLMLLPEWAKRLVLRLSDRRSVPGLHTGDYEDTASGRALQPPLSRGLAAARLRSMKAERAPRSGDVLWNNIGISFFERTCREVIVQFVVFAFLIIFTSPVAMLTAMRLVFSEVALLSDVGSMGHNGTQSLPTNIPLTTALLSSIATHDPVGAGLPSFTDIDADHATEDITKSLMNLLPRALTSNSLLRSVMLAYIPVMLLAVTFAMVPSLLRFTSGLEGYPTHTDREMSIFRKTSFYYLMNAVLLPSLALNTASEFLEVIYKKSNGGANVYNALPILQTLFSGDIAYFLCNYLVQLALSGSVFWLMRLPSSFSMMIRRRLALTPLEAAEAKCTSVFDFPRHYSYSVAVMAMCLLFGFMAPSIWFFACFYYLCKFHVDLYLLRYVHPLTHMDGRLPKLASTFVLVWSLVAQLALAVIFYLQGWVHAGGVTALVGVLTLAACVSVGSHIGIRLLGVIPSIRDYLIERFVMPWFDRTSTSVGTSSASSSSAGSLRESTEVDALLRPRSSWPRGAHQDGRRPLGFSEDAVLSDDSDRDDSMMHWYQGEIAFRRDYGTSLRHW